MTIELTPEEANVLLKLITAGFNKIQGQEYVFTKYGGRWAVGDFLSLARTVNAKVQAQVALQQ
jgi:hypothetical protein